MKPARSSLLLTSLLAAGCRDAPDPTPPLAPAAPAEEAGWREVPGVKRHVVVIVIDTMRLDTLTSADTPTFHRLCRVGQVPKVAWSTSTWTVPSVISMFLGETVRQHGWDLSSGEIGHYPPMPDDPTLAETLKAAGFATTGLYANGYLSEPLGFERGFDTWHKVPDASMAERVRAEVTRWQGPQRQFLYVHLLGPHSPLQPTAPALQRYGLDGALFATGGGLDIAAAKRDDFPGVRDLYRRAYRAATEDADARVGEILEALRPYQDDTALILTSDHGQLLGEHDRYGHGSDVWAKLRQIPFVSMNAGDLPTTLTNAVVPDLVTRAVGVPHRWPTRLGDGTHLVSQREGKLALSPDGNLVGIWQDGTFGAYALDRDPEELVPDATAGPALEAARAAWERSTPGAPALQLTSTLPRIPAEGLRELGYLQP